MTGIRRGIILAAGAAVVLGIVSPIPTAIAADCSQTSVGLTPLMDLGTGTYKGFEGGLYPSGKDGLPKAYRDIGKRRAGKIQPLNANGAPSANGRIVLLSVGMSNTQQKFGAFMQQEQSDSLVNPHLVLVNGAQGGQDAVTIANPDAPFWEKIDGRLAESNVNRQQVEVVWLKEAIAREDRPFPDDAQGLQDLLRQIVQIMKGRYPNLKIVYLASRTYGGYATTDLNPEPFAYESGFAVKWLVGEDIASPAKEHPWLAWGPYLWTDGLDGRSDGLVWTCQDVESDGTHPSSSGEQKVATLLGSFFTKKSTAKPWFLA